MLHVFADRAARFEIQYDFLGDGTRDTYEFIGTPGAGAAHHIFHSGFSAHWARLIPWQDSEASAEFIYT